MQRAMGRPVLYVWFASMSLLTSCASVEQRAFEGCPADGGSWRFLSNPPAEAAEFLAIAQPQPAPRFSFQRVRLYWFANDAGHYLLCRSVLDVSAPGCGSMTWEFYRDEGQTQWKSLDHIVVCG